jgi:hypothetical protein
MTRNTVAQMVLKHVFLEIEAAVGLSVKVQLGHFMCCKNSE